MRIFSVQTIYTKSPFQKDERAPLVVMYSGHPRSPGRLSIKYRTETAAPFLRSTIEAMGIFNAPYFEAGGVNLPLLSYLASAFS